MADSSPVNTILEFLRKNKFTRAEAALLTELSNCSELNGCLENLTLESNGLDNTTIEMKWVKTNAWNLESGSQNNHEVSKELVVKQIECGISNGSESKQKSSFFIGEQTKPHITSGIARGDPGISNASNDPVFELYTGKINHVNGPADTRPTDSMKAANISQKLQTFQLPGSFANGTPEASTGNVKSGKEEPLYTENKNFWLGSTSKANAESHCDASLANYCKDKLQNRSSKAEDSFSDSKWSRRDDPVASSSDIWKDCTVTTVLPLPLGETSAGNSSVVDSDGNMGKKKDTTDTRVAIKEQVDEVGQALYLGKLQGSSDPKNIIDFAQANEKLKEDLPRLPPVRLKSEDKLLTLNCKEKHERDGISVRPTSSDGSLHMGSYLVVPVGQDINPLASNPGGVFMKISSSKSPLRKEHLLIVCELLKANLYEFQKFNRESGGEVYFTMPRIQSITVQCLEALQFLHGLGIIHCDLKPENILVKSYSRSEIKFIDLGSSCFETDHLCSYVQSRSYRAPEVILGLPYSQKIDIWSLGCILAELCTGNVLFQNDSPATLLARVVGIIGMIDQGMLARGRDTYKYFTKNYMLYERNQETSKLECLIPKKSSLQYRLPMGDQGFINFVSYLLEVNPDKRPTAAEALRHPWLSYPYEPISS